VGIVSTLGSAGGEKLYAGGVRACCSGEAVYACICAGGSEDLGADIGDAGNFSGVSSLFHICCKKGGLEER
jgi:hypothetical protein